MLRHLFFSSTPDPALLPLDGTLVDCSGVETSNGLIQKLGETLGLGSNPNVSAVREHLVEFTGNIILSHFEGILRQSDCYVFLAFLRGITQNGLFLGKSGPRWILIGVDIKGVNDAMIHGVSNPTYLFFKDGNKA